MVSPYTAYSVSIVTANRLEKINLIVAWDSETDLIFIFKIMKKGSIVKGFVVVGVLDKIDDYQCYIKYSSDRFMKRWIHVTWIHKDVISIPTKKEKEEYKKFLLKNGYSYYRGKVTKEL